MNSENDFKQKARAREALVKSAHFAHRQGVAQDFWMKHPSVQKIKFDFRLRDDILLHIAAFVWTFSK